MSPCDYDLFTKVKEPLRGTRYNTRDEFIHAIGRSVRNISNDGHADGVRRLPKISQKVINKGGSTIFKVRKCCTPVNKSGLGSSSGKALGYGLDGPGSIPGVGGGADFSSLLRVQTGPEIHAASYKMSTGGFPLG